MFIELSPCKNRCMRRENGDRYQSWELWECILDMLSEYRRFGLSSTQYPLWPQPSAFKQDTHQRPAIMSTLLCVEIVWNFDETKLSCSMRPAFVHVELVGTVALLVAHVLAVQWDPSVVPRVDSCSRYSKCVHILLMIAFVHANL